MASLLIEVEDNDVDITFKSLFKRFSPLSVRTFFEADVRAYFITRFGNAFRVGGRANGWPPLAVKTRMDKQRIGAPMGAILVRTGYMRQRIMSFKGSFDGRIFTIPSDGEREGFGRYAGHQLGAPHGGKSITLPRRKVVELAGEDTKNIYMLAHAFFLRGK